MKKRKGKKSGAADLVDVDELVLDTARESYLDAVEDLRARAQQVRELNKQKKSVRGYLASLRAYRSSILPALRQARGGESRHRKTGPSKLAEAFAGNAFDYEVTAVDIGLGIPPRVPAHGVSSEESLDDEIVRWEQVLATLGDDAQLANLDLQNALQKQQQALQLLSNISKILHETTMAIIRKLD